MYSEQDFNLINARIRRNLAVLIPLVVVLLAAYIYSMRARIEWLGQAVGALLVITACYGLIAHLIPNLRYRFFLRDMQNGLTREMRGTIVSIAEKSEEHDGARVLPVHLLLSEDQDERIVYLNASKAEGFPRPGAEVLLRLYGRHIREVLPQKG